MGGQPASCVERFGMSTVCSILLGSWTMASSEVTQPTGLRWDGMGWEAHLLYIICIDCIHDFFVPPILVLVFLVFFLAIIVEMCK